MHKPIFYTAGEGALTVSFGDSINKEYSQKVFQLYHRLLQCEEKFWLDLIPAYTTLTVVYDPVTITEKSPAVWVRKFIEEILETEVKTIETLTRQVTIPVCYASEFALDASKLCKERTVSHDKLVRLHTERTYTVYMLGFLPGFPYMGSVDSRIATPRLSKPRTVVPAGSVGIAGEQTGIYPLESPGGWNIIGKTPLKLFDVLREQPVLLTPGDQVSFVAISREEFENFDVTTFNFLQHES